MNVLLFSLFFALQIAEPSSGKPSIHKTDESASDQISSLKSSATETSDSAGVEVDLGYTPFRQRLYSATPEFQTMFGIRASGGSGNILIGRSKSIEVYRNDGEGLKRTAVLAVGKDISNPGTFGTNFVSDGVTVAEISLGTGSPQKVTIYRYLEDTWKNLPHISHTDIPAKDVKLKRKVSVRGNHIAVLSNRGVEIFAFDGSRYVWKQLVARPSAINERLFGSSLTLGPDKIAVGCWRGPTTQEHVEVFALANGVWSHTGHIVDARGGPSERFGVQTAFDGKHLLVAASNWSEGTGCILVYAEVESDEEEAASIQRSWKEVQRVTQREGNECCFGTSFMINGNVMAVAACSKVTNGSVILFKRTGPQMKWVFDDLVLPDPSMGTVRFGSDLALSDTELVVGIPFGSKDEIGSTGMIQVYDLN
jgi:hypothetical protein